MAGIIAWLLNPKNWIVLIAIIRELIQLIKLAGAEKARDTLKEQCRQCEVNKGES